MVRGQHRDGRRGGAETKRGFRALVRVVGALGALLFAIYVCTAFAVTASYRKRLKTSEATANVRRLQDASLVYFAEHQRFPGSVSLTPGSNAQARACEANQRLYFPSAWDEPTWEALGFEQSDPHRYHYQYNSVGVEGSASFTASALGDLDCDGVYSTFVRFGTVTDGLPQGSSGLYIANELE